jgi:hypothetical protein
MEWMKCDPNLCTVEVKHRPLNWFFTQAVNLMYNRHWSISVINIILN